MSKNTKRGLIILAIVLVVFNVIAFALPFAKTSVFWIGYAFGMIAILFQAYVLKVAFVDGKDAKSKFYGFPIAKVGFVYLVAQMLISILSMALAEILPNWVSIVLCVLALAAAAIGCMATEIMKEEIEHQDTKIKTDVSNMRSLQSISASLVGMTQDSDTKKMLQELADDFKYSDPVSSESVIDRETELIAQANVLQQALIDGDNESAKKLCLKLKADLAERNRICKLNK